MANKSQYVYYASYGSNMNRERLHVYIHGGCPEGSTKHYSGSSEKEFPRIEEPFFIEHELTFSRHSKVWDGGVCFIDPAPNSAVRVMCKRYLVTLKQFNDIVAQENARDIGTDHVTFSHILLAEKESQGLQIFDRGWYNTLVHLGRVNVEDEEVHVVTFTTTKRDYDRLKYKAPSESYLAHIIKGLNQSGLSCKEIDEYVAEIKSRKR